MVMREARSDFSRVIFTLFLHLILSSWKVIQALDDKPFETVCFPEDTCTYRNVSHFAVFYPEAAQGRGGSVSVINVSKLGAETGQRLCDTTLQFTSKGQLTRSGHLVRLKWARLILPKLEEALSGLVRHHHHSFILQCHVIYHLTELRGQYCDMWNQALHSKFLHTLADRQIKFTCSFFHHRDNLNSGEIKCFLPLLVSKTFSSCFTSHPKCTLSESRLNPYYVAVESKCTTWGTREVS